MHNPEGPIPDDSPQDKRIITVSANSLNLSACMRKYDYSKLRRRETFEKAPSIDKGDLVHQVLAHYYKAKMSQKELGLSHTKMVELAIERGRQAAVTLDLDIDSSEECIRTCQQYLTHYAGDPWVPVAVEAPFSIVLFEDDDIRIVFEGRVDLIVENPLQNNMKIVVDHKTGSRNTTPSGLSNQFMGYCVAFGVTMSVLNKIGFQKTLPPAKKFVRHVLPYPKKVLDEWVEWTVWRARFIDACTQEGTFPPDFTKCDEYSGCQYKEVCTSPPDSRDDKLARFFRVREKFDVLTTESE